MKLPRRDLLKLTAGPAVGGSGLQVDVGAMTSGAVIYAAILGGAAQFGSGNLFSVFSAYARGVPLRIVAPITIYTTDNADTFLIVRKDDPIHSARDFNGK